MLDTYLIKNYNKLKDIAYNITNGKGNDDLLSFVIEELYKCDKERIAGIIRKKQMTFYAVRVMINQFHSKTSRYYYKYNKYYEYHVSGIVEAISPNDTEKHIEEKELIEEQLEWVEEKLKELYWFDAEVFRIYYREGFSLNQMQKQTKINRNTLHKAITNVKNYLINKK
jgi:DNA-directed RNA polymerase specialized sigma24 family protein